jgi:hypothetical protein
MTPLRQRMSEDMQVRNLAPHTQRSYLQQVSQFARHFGKSPDLLGPDDIRAYQLHLTQEKQLSASSVLVAVAATVPDGFHRIRHIGFLANCHRTAKLALCRGLLAVSPPSDPEPPRRWQDRLRDLTGHDIEVCPGCGGRMLPHGTLRPCPPPRPPMWCDSS